MQFIGAINKGRGGEYYGTWGLFNCAGYAIDLLGPDRFHDDNDGFGWGYDGFDADLLSVSLLARSLWPAWLTERDENGDPSAHPNRDLIIKHYRAFTEEIVANLPDSWTMTSDEVLAWLKKKEANESKGSV